MRQEGGLLPSATSAVSDAVAQMLNEWSMPESDVHQLSDAHTKIWFNDMRTEEKNNKDKGYLNANFKPDLNPAGRSGHNSNTGSIGGSINSSSQVSHESKRGDKDQDKVTHPFNTIPQFKTVKI